MTPQTVVLLSFALSAVGALAVAPLVIKGLKRLKAGQTVLGYVTQHEHKTGTPSACDVPDARFCGAGFSGRFH